jgi:zinc transporter ZupT
LRLDLNLGSLSMEAVMSVLAAYPLWAQAAIGFLSGHMICYSLIRTVFSKTTVNKDPHLAAHFLPQMAGFVALAYGGAKTWLYEVPVVSVPAETATMFFGPGQRLCMIMIGLQIYECLACIPCKRLRGNALGFEMIAHHAVTLGLAVLGYRYQA